MSRPDGALADTPADPSADAPAATAPGPRRPRQPRQPRRPRRPHPWLTLALVLTWLVTTVAIAAALFLGGSRTTVVAGHDATVSPALDGHATVDVGPYLPRFRVETGSRLGAVIDLGATDLDSYAQLTRRYALLASAPEGQIEKVRATLTDHAVDSVLLGGLAALVAPGVVLLVGRRRWAELLHPWTWRRSAATGAAVALSLGTLVVVNDADEPRVRDDSWQQLAAAFPDVAVPPEAASLQIETGLMTTGSRRLVESAVTTYRKSLDFYTKLVEAAPALDDQLRQPQEGEVVALLVADRHDNVGMDPVARAVAEAGGASFLLNAGDDTSTGGSWEAFSLESLDEAFADFDDRYSVAGNHDHGDFVTETFERLGFTTLTGEVVDGPAGIRILGAGDVRSSGLGSWRDEGGDVSFAEQKELLADKACEHDADGDRISTLMVHDANSGRTALDRGCVDLVLAGHLHVQVGPDRVVGENGKVGYIYTNGTTGGAAYAVALGSKLRRDADVTLVTYRDGRPVGLQSVTARPIGDFRVGSYLPLDLGGLDPTGEPGESEDPELEAGDGSSSTP